MKTYDDIKAETILIFHECVNVLLPFQVAQLVAEEFFQQGDREAKELNMTPMVNYSF